MSKSRRAGLVLVPITAIGVACGVAPGLRTETTEQAVSAAPRLVPRGVMPVRTANATPAATGTCPLPQLGGCPPPPVDAGPPPPPPHLVDYGGRIIGQVRIVQVLWGGGGIFSPQVLGISGPPSLPDFYAQLERNGIFDWLSEYNTPTQSMSRGTYVGSYTIVPSPDHNGATITDDEIQAELRAGLASGVLPKPGYSDPFDYVYMINFPQGRSLIDSFGDPSCVDPHDKVHVAFCAYHWGFDYLGTNIYYAVLPDISPGSPCVGGCGLADPLGNQTSVASHELAEMITDPQVGYANWSAPPGLPFAWFDPTWGEVGDICNQDQWPFLAYQVQTEWSNLRNKCFTTTACLDPNACTGKCGLVTNACGVQVDCGGCAAPQTCGGGGAPGVCGCTPNPHPCGRGQCGISMPDGCGNFVQCEADCSLEGLCPCRGGQCRAGACVCYKGPCL